LVLTKKNSETARKVSVCIPTYNRKHYLREALESVFAQTYKDFEVVIVDDGSTDGTDQMLKESGYAVRYYWQENQGDIRNTIIEENSFDVIFTRHCLEHLDRPDEAIKNMARMLKAGGTLLAIVPKENIKIDTKKSLHSYLFQNDNDLSDLILTSGLKVVSKFTREEFRTRKQKYWYKVSLRQRLIGAELWVLATK